MCSRYPVISSQLVGILDAYPPPQVYDCQNKYNEHPRINGEQVGMCHIGKTLHLFVS